MSVDSSQGSAEVSILENLTLDYRKLGFGRNPFESIPVFSDLQPVPFNGYLRYYLNRLSSIVFNATASRPVCIYLIGPPGSGKSAILRALSRIPYPRGKVFPIHTRFPLAGGRLAFYNEFLRRLPIPLLKLLFYYARNNYLTMTRTYIGAKLYWASTCEEPWKSLERMKISPQYMVESISDLISIILDLTDNNRIALILDEFEHAWARFTGAQKYNWEKTIVELLLKLGSKLVLVLPVLPQSVAFGSRPYLDMYDWKGIDLDLILKATNSNTVEINCTQTALKNCIYSILRREILNKQGEYTCKTLLNSISKYATIGEAITDLRGRILMMAYRGRSWEACADYGDK